MTNQIKLTAIVIVSLLLSFGISIIIYFYPRSVEIKSNLIKTNPAEQFGGQIAGLKKASTGTVEKITDSDITIHEWKGSTTFLFNTPWTYILFRNKLGVKGYVKDLKVGQKIQFTSKTNDKGKLVVTDIVIEDNP